MSQPVDRSSFTFNGKIISMAELQQLCNDVIADKITQCSSINYNAGSGSQDNYVYLLQVVQANELQYDSLKLFSRIVSSLLKAEANELIDLILSKPPKYEPKKESEYLKSFEAYKEFCFHLLAFNCACIKKVTNFALIEALKLCTQRVSESMTLKVGSRFIFESIEDIQKRARQIAAGAKKKELTLIKNSDDLEFMTELLKTHPNAREKGILGQETSLQIFTGRSKQNTPCFYIAFNPDDITIRSTPSADDKKNGFIDISYMKSINEIAVKLSHSMIRSMRELPSDVKILLDFIVTLIQKFPNAKSKIIQLITKTMPHAMMSVQMHSIFIKIIFYLIDKLPTHEEELLSLVLSRF